MKKNGISSSAVLAPDAHGWRLRIAGGETKTLPTLQDVVAAMPGQTALELALPCNSVLLERHLLPATDRAELADMIQLQLEKTLPFPVDEVSHDFEVIGQGDNESTVLSVAASHAELDQICGPLREQGLLPERITLHAMLRVSACPPNETTLAIWAEQDHLVIAIASGGRLGWAQTIDSIDPTVIETALPGLLITAEIDGVPTEFDSVRLAPECMNLEALVVELFKKPVLPLPEVAESAVMGGELDLLPESWQYAAKQRERDAKLKQNLLLVAVFYLVLIAGAFVYLAILHNRDKKLMTELNTLAPKYTAMKAQKARANTLAPAFEPTLTAAEVMRTLELRVRGNKNLQFTSFTFRPSGWDLKVEGTTDGYFVFTQALKNDAAFNEIYDLNVPNQTGSDERRPATITGRPKPPPAPIAMPGAPGALPTPRR